MCEGLSKAGRGAADRVVEVGLERRERLLQPRQVSLRLGPGAAHEALASAAARS